VHYKYLYAQQITGDKSSLKAQLKYINNKDATTVPTLTATYTNNVKGSNCTKAPALQHGVKFPSIQSLQTPKQQKALSQRSHLCCQILFKPSSSAIFSVPTQYCLQYLNTLTYKTTASLTYMFSRQIIYALTEILAELKPLAKLPLILVQPRSESWTSTTKDGKHKTYYSK